jgi:RND family efflux transporter MFP subunit
MKPVSSLSFFLAPVLLLGCAPGGRPAPGAPPSARAQLAHSAAEPLPQTIETTGTVRAKETAIVSAQTSGRIRQVLVEAGSRVRAGQLLATLDGSAMQAALLQATAAEAAAQKLEMAAQSDASLAAETLARYRILKDQKSVSPQEFDEVERRSEAAQLRVASYAAQTREAEAAVAGARVQVGYAELHAPFDGIVTARTADPGTLAAPGMPLLQIDRDGPLQVYAAVDESMVGSVRLGMAVPVRVDGAAPSSLNGVVAQIVPAADPASRSVLVKLDLPPAKNIRTGMYATAGFPGASRMAIVAPESAVVLRGSLACVYALDGSGLAQLRYVTLGNRRGDLVEILSGLTAGETLVNNPGDRDLSGRRIEAEQ